MEISSEPDAGIYDAMNRALGRVSTEAVLFLNEGDFLTGPHALQSLASKMGDEFDVAIGQTFHFGRDFVRRETPCLRPKWRVAWQGFNHQATLYRTEWLRGRGGFDESFGWFADYHATLQAWNQGKATVLPHPVCWFRAFDHPYHERLTDKQAAWRGATGRPYPLTSRAGEIVLAAWRRTFA